MTPRVLMVTPGFRGRPGGVEVHCSELVAGLARYDVDIEVITATRDIRRRVQKSHGDCDSTVYPAWRTQAMSIAPRVVLGAARRQSAADIVHVHSYHATTAVAALVTRKPVVFTPHYHGQQGHSVTAGLLHKGFRHLGVWVLRRADAIICVSQAERDLLVSDFPFVTERVEVIPNGAHVEELRGAEPFPKTTPTVLCVGRLEPYKRFADVIRCLPDVAPRARLVIIGRGSQEDELRSLVTDLGLDDRVQLCGRIDTDILRRWYRTADVLVSMSDHEAFGMVPLEAAAAGARVVLSDIPAHREVFADHLRGRGAVVGDDSPLAQHISAQLALGRLSTPAEVPSWQSIADRTAQTYQRLTARSGSPSLEVPRRREVTR